MKLKLDDKNSTKFKTYLHVYLKYIVSSLNYFIIRPICVDFRWFYALIRTLSTGLYSLEGTNFIQSFIINRIFNCICKCSNAVYACTCVILLHEFLLLPKNERVWIVYYSRINSNLFTITHAIMSINIAAQQE